MTWAQRYVLSQYNMPAIAHGQIFLNVSSDLGPWRIVMFAQTKTQFQPAALSYHWDKWAKHPFCEAWAKTSTQCGRGLPPTTMANFGNNCNGFLLESKRKLHPIAKTDTISPISVSPVVALILIQTKSGFFADYHGTSLGHTNTNQRLVCKLSQLQIKVPLC